jgi:hypothetical protein
MQPLLELLGRPRRTAGSVAGALALLALVTGIGRQVTRPGQLPAVPCTQGSGVLA